MPSTITGLPTSVSMAYQPSSQTIFNNLTIIDNRQNHRKIDLGVCLTTPLYNIHNDQLFKIINFIEILKLFGAQIFYLL